MGGIMLSRSSAVFVMLAFLGLLNAPSRADTYVLLGVQPAATEVVLSAGTVQDGKFEQSFAGHLWGGHTYWARSEDGYVLIKTDDEPTLALLRVFSRRTTHSLLGTWYTPCADAGSRNLAEAIMATRGTIAGNAMVFEPPIDKVTYIGSVAFARNEEQDSLTPTYTNDLEGAREFLRTHHPELADKLEQGTYELTPAAGCR